MARPPRPWAAGSGRAAARSGRAGPESPTSGRGPRRIPTDGTDSKFVNFYFLKKLTQHHFLCSPGAPEIITGNFITGYLKAVWPEIVGCFLRSGRPRGPPKMWRASPPTFLKAFPGPPGPARPQKRTPKNPARLTSGTQHIKTLLKPIETH